MRSLQRRGWRNFRCEKGLDSKFDQKRPILIRWSQSCYFYLLLIYNDFLNLRQALCSCEEGFFLHEGACVPCSGPGAHLIDGECSCGLNAELSDDDETCICNENYLAFEVSYELNHINI